MEINLGRFQSTVRLWPALAGAAALAVLTGLGTWQMQRAADKEDVLSEYHHNSGLAPVPLHPYAGDRQAEARLHLRAVRATGVVDGGRQFLLDNRVRQGRPGFEVLVPLRLGESGAAVLLNRGWVARGALRSDKPSVAPAAGLRAVTVQGLAVRPARGFHLGAMLEPGSEWPHIVQFLSLPEMERLLGYPLLPVVVRLDAQQSLALVTGWPPLAVGPDRHYGYAVQWFGMAVVLLAVLVAASTRRRW